MTIDSRGAADIGSFGSMSAMFSAELFTFPCGNGAVFPASDDRGGGGGRRDIHGLMEAFQGKRFNFLAFVAGFFGFSCCTAKSSGGGLRP